MCLVGSLTLELLADLANLVHSPLEGRSDDGLDIQPSTASAPRNEATADNRKVELLVKLAVVGAYGADPVLRLTRRTTRLHVDASQGTGRVTGGTLLNTNRKGRLQAASKARSRTISERRRSKQTPVRVSVR